ncbi:LysR family transcriptional regulator [Bradyrhizobium sp. LHD-71]|uniref:LysR family transcriptional regulator n=1 Tax=Bradyrhizobium sp. LHD-71 TaxID=3072141 RepID=UPI00280DECA7|nr:LysR family transcriptional regulator [Bradyrhizobium sp. LHD-71]MDQ8732429.1 LysR family transcriptional regulator [Bradyrhizobium sp. LHD-71]
MDILKSIQVFARVAELGSFTRAADLLSISNAAATRHVSFLEARFGVRLLERTTRRLRLTEAGQICLDHCLRALSELELAESAASHGVLAPEGTLRVSSTSLFWMFRIAPRLPDFLRRYPKLTLQVNLTERQPDLVEEGYDASVQFLDPVGQTMIVRRLRRLHRVVCAAPDYLARRGRPEEIADLTGHDCLLYAQGSEVVEWEFDTPEGRVAVAPTSQLRSTDAQTLRLAALAGLGVVRSPHFLIEEDLQAGRLVPLLLQWRSVDPDLYVVLPSRKFMPAKLRVFLDFLSEEFGERDDSTPINP